jgi:hypothetical protein
MIVAPPAYAEKEVFGYASTHVVNLLDSSMSEGEPTPLKCRQKRTSKSPSPDASLVPPRVADTPMIQILLSSLFALLLLVLE